MYFESFFACKTQLAVRKKWKFVMLAIATAMYDMRGDF